MADQPTPLAAPLEDQTLLPPNTSEFQDSTSPWWRICDLTVFGVWAMVVATVLPRHEPWPDEAQAWLIARDLDLRAMWFHELRYEGTPGLWHTILWIAQHWFHASYSALGVIGALCALAGVVFVLWKSPFPRPITYLLVLSYVFLYQYAIVARSYNLLLLLVFLMAYLYRDPSRPVAMTIVLILLANVAIHGVLLAASFGSCYLLEAYKLRTSLDEATRRRYLFCIGAMLLAFAFLAVVLWPTPDVSEFAKVPPGASPHGDTTLMKFEAVIDLSFFDQTYVSGIFLILAATWCHMRRMLLVFVLPVSLLMLLYVAIHGRPHHHGTVFLAAMAAFWIAWPTPRQYRAFSSHKRLATWGMIALLALMLTLNVWDAYAALVKDYLYPYCGSEDAARYLKQVRADRTIIYGYTFGISAVEAYFDRNIFANMPTTYFHQGLPAHGAFLDYDEVSTVSPAYLVLFSANELADFRNIDPQLRARGYALVHFSKGNVFYKRFAFDTSSYFIYRRVYPPVVP